MYQLEKESQLCTTVDNCVYSRNWLCSCDLYNYTLFCVVVDFFFLVGYPKIVLCTLYKYPWVIWKYLFSNLSSELNTDENQQNLYVPLYSKGDLRGRPSNLFKVRICYLDHNS